MREGRDLKRLGMFGRRIKKRMENRKDMERKGSERHKTASREL